MRRNETTGKKAASAAGRVLRDKRSTKDAKRAAGSALTQVKAAKVRKPKDITIRGEREEVSAYTTWTAAENRRFALWLLEVADWQDAQERKAKR